MLSNLPIAKCRENYIINTNYFSIHALIILVGKTRGRFPDTGYQAWAAGVLRYPLFVPEPFLGYLFTTKKLPPYYPFPKARGSKWVVKR